jgi:hypothetical protein
MSDSYREADFARAIESVDVVIAQLEQHITMAGLSMYEAPKQRADVVTLREIRARLTQCAERQAPRK